MFPLWDAAIAPVLRAAGVRRVVEIGALRGETTTKMLKDLGPECELHVIDPVPGFDPREHEAQFPGRYSFHEALSLDVLPTLAPMDAALIDGDHNWYTVFHELRLLSEVARAAGAPLPVIVMHDVLWPYGRRDLYYAPEQIPPEFRQPYAQRGMAPGSKELLASGGLSPTMNNALEEGGPRNGVMTALDDFVAGYDKALRVLVLPIYFGLAIVVEEERLARQPELAAALDRLEAAEGRADLLDVAETVRLRAMIYQHNVTIHRTRLVERAVARHLRVVKAALLNEHYLDHEVRFEQLSAHITDHRPLVANDLRDPVRNDQTAYRRVARNRLGANGPEPGAAGSFLPYTAMGRPQLDHLEHCLDTVRTEQLAGDLLECGTSRGGGAIFMRAYLDAHELPDRRVWVADAFRSSPAPDRAPHFTRAGVAGFQADLNLVRDGFERFDLLDDRVRFLLGEPAATLADEDTGPLALVRIGRSAGADARAVLDRVYDRLVVGGFVVVDAPEGSDVRAVVEAFRRDQSVDEPLEVIDSSAVAWRKTSDAATVVATRPGAPGSHPPLAPAAPTGAIDLTVVVVVYNMRREAQRTLHALSRVYQEDVADIDYEVIVVENGSAPEQRLGAEFVAGFGPEFRYLDLGDSAEPSPVFALNRGIRAGRGRNFALMIDGAHVVTPGIVRFGLAGLATYSPAIVATQQWYIGPGQQGEAMDNGYDQAYEDRLFESIGWPNAGYRLFEIGHFIGDRDWFDGLWESNCMFVARAQLEQVGCFDERFSVAGGGYANLELYERLGSSPDVRVTTIIGEGSFHQVHGGTTTNQTDADERRSRVFGYSQEYADLRGRAFKGPGKPIHFVGRISTEAARRSKPRRLSSPAFADAAAGDRDGLPTTPTPVPDELKWAFTESVWRNLPWSGTTWLGRAIETAPTDLLAYQEMIVTVRPDWIVEIGSGDGGRALFLASICELTGHGEVLSVDTELPTDLPEHPRLHFLTGDAHDPATVAAVQQVVGTDSRAIVVLGGRADRHHTSAQFEAYAPLVPVGSYVVVTDTIVNGHPVWPAFGPGPLEGVKQILNRRGDFVADPDMEKYSLTFNPGGFLRRVR
jgi:cephalosporin hydroxylase